MNNYLQTFKAREKLGAKKLNKQLSQVIENRSFQSGVSSPGGHAPLEVRKINSPAVDAPYPFEVIQDANDPEAVAIRGGLFDVLKFNGEDHATEMSPESLSIDEGGLIGNFTGSGSLPTDLATTTATIPTDTTRWIYLIAGTGSAIGVGELAQATALYAYISTDATRPDESTIDNPANTGFQLNPKSLRVLAQVVNTDGRLEIFPEWTGGNIKEVAVGLDSYDGYHRASGQLSSDLLLHLYKCYCS